MDFIERKAVPKHLVTLVLAVAGCLFLVRFPLFRIVVHAHRASPQEAAFDAAALAADLWRTKLDAAVTRATDVEALWTDLSLDAASARRRHGHSYGISERTLFFVRGNGHVVAVDVDTITVSLDGSAGKVSLLTGPLFGNTVRDATELVDVSSFASSQDFNDLSEQLDRLVETNVILPLKQKVAVGNPIRFVGCIELEERSQPEALPVIPLRIDWP